MSTKAPLIVSSEKQIFTRNYKGSLHIPKRNSKPVSA